MLKNQHDACKVQTLGSPFFRVGFGHSRAISTPEGRVFVWDPSLYLVLLHTPVIVQTPGLAMKQKIFKMHISRGEI